MNGPEIESALGMRQPVSALTHMIWCVVAAFVAALLVRLCRGNRVKQVSLAVFGVSLVLQYGVSSVFHVVPADRPDLVNTFRLIDLSAIYLLIAGSYTPLFAVLLAGRLRVAMLGLVWGLAVVGVVCKWLLPLPPDGLAVSLYLATGLAGFLPTPAMLRVVRPRGVLLAFLGAVLYTAGALCDTWHWPLLVPGWIGPHEVLHVLDIFGTTTHLLFMAIYFVPFQGAGAGTLIGSPMIDPARGA
jgi:hemolysin III